MLRMRVPMFLVGAFARDLQFLHMYRIEPGRRTEDVDISIQLRDWEMFNAISQALIKDGFENPFPGHPEKFRDKSNGQEVDLLPFGEISKDGKTILWPGDKKPWTITGMNEAFENALQFELVGGSERHAIRFITAPSFVVLKFISLYERPEERQKYDGPDIGFVMEHYLDIGNRARLSASPHDDIMDIVNGNLDHASALLLGRDIRASTSDAARKRVVEILQAECTSSSRVRLARELRLICEGDFREARRRLKWIQTGLTKRVA